MNELVKHVAESDSSHPVERLLRAIPIFADLPPAVLARLTLISEEFSVTRGTALCVQGLLPDVLHVLTEGQVALTGAAPDGTTAVVDVLRPVSHFVLAAVLTEQAYLMSAIAVQSCTGVAINAAGLRQLLREEPALALAVLHAQARDFRLMVRQVRDLKLRSAAQRLGCYLLALVEAPDAVRADIRLPFEKGLLAARLGCRAENLSRAFATLREHGVRTHGTRVLLQDIDRLRAFAVPDALPDPPWPDPGQSAVPPGEI